MLMDWSLQTKLIQCPYCWEQFEVVVDPSESHQCYIEDCFVCCRPITIDVQIDEDGEIEVTASADEYS